MSWYEYGFDYDEETCKQCGNTSSGEFCSKGCAKEYEVDN